MTALLLAASLLAATPAQDTAVPVTYTTRAARAEQVVKDLKVLSKVDLEVSPQTKNEVLIVSAKGVPLSDLMARIASVTSGEWKQEGAAYRLVGDVALRDREERAEAAKRTEAIRKAIQDRAANEKKTFDAINKQLAAAEAKARADAKAKKGQGDTAQGDADHSDADDSQNVSLEDQLITGLLKGIDPSVLGQIEAGDRLVFSTDPTRTQRALGGDATEIINDYIQNHDKDADQTPPDLTEATSGMTDQQAELFREMMKHQHTGKIGHASKALLIASKGGGVLGMFGASQLQLEFRIYDANGKTVSESNSTLEGFGVSFLNGVMSTAAPDSDSAVAVQGQATSQAKGTPIELCKDSQEYLAAFKGLSGVNPKIKLSPELRQKLVRPDLCDPLSLVDTDELMAYAAWVGKPIVADLPDPQGEIALSGAPAVPTLEAFAKELKDGKSMVVAQDDAFVLVKPAEPAKSRTDRLDRFALTTLIRAASEKGVASLDDLATFATNAPNPMEGGVALPYLMMFVPGGMPLDMSGMVNWDMLRFYADLSSDSRSLLANGGRLSMGSLTAGQQSLVEKMVYGSECKLSVAEPGKKPEQELPFFMSFMQGSGTDDYRAEPTEVVPNGLPPGGYIETGVTTEPFAAPVNEGDATTMAFLGVLDPDELAMFKRMRSTPGLEQAANSIPKFQQLRMGQSSILKFTFHLTPSVSLKQTLKDHQLGADAGVYSEDNLPPGFQKLIADRAAALKNSPFGSIGSMMGGAEGIKP